MKKVIEQYPAEVFISAADLEYANLNEWERLELHLLNQAAVVIPGQMTVMELIRTAETLQKLAAELLATLGTACEKCDGCKVELLCDLMKGESYSRVKVPGYVLEEMDYDPDCKPVCAADPENGVIQIKQADYQHDLTDIPSDLLDTLREAGICLNDLEEKIIQEKVVYGKCD